MYRKTKWLEIFEGPDYIDSAFRFAHEADPKAKLYYNEFNSEREVKRGKDIQTPEETKSHGVPIDGSDSRRIGRWIIQRLQSCAPP